MVKTTCIFCLIVEDKAASTKVYEDNDTLAFMDINPGARGHTLVIPKRHAEDLYALSVEEYTRVAQTTRKVAEAIRETLRPDGLNIFQANGTVAFQTVFHFHNHILPRYSDDGIHLPYIPKPGDPEEIRISGESIRGYFTRP